MKTIMEEKLRKAGFKRSKGWPRKKGKPIMITITGDFKPGTGFAFQFMSTKEKSYEAWKKQVDDQLFNKIGLDSDGIPDFSYKAAYEDGWSPSKTAAAAIRAGKEF